MKGCWDQDGSRHPDFFVLEDNYVELIKKIWKVACPSHCNASYFHSFEVRVFLETGDIIIFRHDGKLLVKRIAAMEGDMVKKNGVSMMVPEGCYYVLGDNADNSYDSRFWEEPFVGEGDMVAKVVLH